MQWAPPSATGPIIMASRVGVVTMHVKRCCYSGKNKKKSKTSRENDETVQRACMRGVLAQCVGAALLGVHALACAWCLPSCFKRCRVAVLSSFRLLRDSSLRGLVVSRGGVEPSGGAWRQVAADGLG